MAHFPGVDTIHAFQGASAACGKLGSDLYRRLLLAVAEDLAGGGELTPLVASGRPTGDRAVPLACSAVSTGSCSEATPPASPSTIRASAAGPPGPVAPPSSSRWCGHIRWRSRRPSTGPRRPTRSGGPHRSSVACGGDRHAGHADPPARDRSQRRAQPAPRPVPLRAGRRLEYGPPFGAGYRCLGVVGPAPPWTARSRSPRAAAATSSRSTSPTRMTSSGSCPTCGRTSSTGSSGSGEPSSSPGPTRRRWTPNTIRLATDRLAHPYPGAVTVVMQSIVTQYLTAAERHQVFTTVRAAGKSATRRAPVAWLRMEPAPRSFELRLWCGPRTPPHPRRGGGPRSLGQVAGDLRPGLTSSPCPWKLATRTAAMG